MMIRTTRVLPVAVGVLLLTATVTRAAATPEQTCQKGRYAVAAQYSACQQKVLAKYVVDVDIDKFQTAASKCRVKYTSTWVKLQAKAPGSTCDTARFMDNGTTVTDHLTALQWQKAPSLASWSSVVFGTAADGTAFTSSLSTLNSGCLAGQCDWRLPTISELQTILLEPYPCTTFPCIDAVFGFTGPNLFWSATTNVTSLDYAWSVNFFDGFVLDASPKSGSNYVRAVRGGL